MIFFIGGLLSCKQSANDKSLLLYCAAGMKPPIEVLAREYEKKYGIQISIQYGGSGTLLSSIRITNTGDIFLAADESYIHEASKLNLIEEAQPLAYITPVIAVKKSNPKNINNIQDLLREDISFALANPGAASIGRHTKNILEGSGQWAAIREAVTVLKPTVNDVANDIRLGTVDAGIIWDATAMQYESIEIIESEMLKKHPKQVTIGVLSTSEQPTNASDFLKYLSSHAGSVVFKSMGYKLHRSEE